MKRSALKSALRLVVKNLVPYCVEDAYVRRRYGKAGYFDGLDALEGGGVVARTIRAALPYGLVMALRRRRFRTPSASEHQADFPRVVALLRERLLSGGRLRALFLVADESMFPAAPLCRAMSDDASFEPVIAVVPDFRHAARDVLPRMERCERSLAASFPSVRMLRLRPLRNGDWPDVLGETDVVCYPTPHDSSFVRYCIRYSAGRDVLPIHVNYGYYRSVYDRAVMSGENYAHFWKVFFECDETMKEYTAHSILKGGNAELSGYVKMDDLALKSSAPRTRKRILVALHHSVEGGKNERLSLANIVRLADFFLSLPVRYRGVDFVFRPHPFLVETLSREDVWGAERTRAYFSQLRSQANVVWSEGPDYFQAFADSDACIQDCGSYLVEYLYTGRPCCYILKSPSDVEAKFAPLGRKCLDACRIAYDAGDIDAFIRKVVLAGEDDKAAARRALLPSIAVNYPHASIVALNAIKKDLS